MTRAPVCLLALVWLGWTSPAAALTDCSKPKTNIDRLMCSSDKVALADQVMAMAFRDAFYRTLDKDALIKEQEEWRKKVRDACNDVPCLMEAYERRTSELETY
jgi:uncharacterized protein